MAYKNIQDQKDFHKKWYLKNKERLILKAKDNNKKYCIRNKEFLNKFKLEKGCLDCGYKDNAIALDFDHLDDKKFNLSILAKRYVSINSLKEEINKCEVVCSNCHRVRTEKRRMAKLVDATVSKTESC